MEGLNDHLQSDIGRKPMDLTEWAYFYIRQMILDTTLQAKSQINIDQMASQLNISRTPVREALLRLQEDGLVSVVPHVGCFVTAMSKEDVREAMELRCIIEGYAAMVAATNISKENMKKLREGIKQSTKAALEGDPVLFNASEIMIHDSIMKGIENNRISTVMDQIATLTYRERNIAKHNKKNIEQSVAEHQQILEAIESKNPEKARLAMENHIRSVERRLEALLFDNEDSDK